MKRRGSFAFGLVAAFACSPSPAPPAPTSSLCGANGVPSCAANCDPTLGCVDCETDGDCAQLGPPAGPRCVRGACVVCATSADCTGGKTCWPGDHTCNAPCTGTSCLSEMTTKICNDGACVGC